MLNFKVNKNFELQLKLTYEPDWMLLGHHRLEFSQFSVYFSRAKPAECEGVSCSEEAKVSIPRRAGSRPRKGCARTSEGAGGGKSFKISTALSSLVFSPSERFISPSYFARIYPISYPSLPAMQRDDINPFLGKVCENEWVMRLLFLRTAFAARRF